MYQVESAPPFQRQLKRLLKKYPSLKKEHVTLIEMLTKNPTMGTPLGHNIYKIRLGVASKGAGKRGGARVITYVMVQDEKVFLMAIYDKSEQDTMTTEVLQQLVIRIING